MLFDYVCQLKNIPNLCLTEKTWELIFNDNGVKQVANWAHLKKLYRFESKRQVELSDLNEISISRKHIEWPPVSPCVTMFSEWTYNSLLTLSGISVDKNDTAIFINKVLTLGKILNVKTIQIDHLLNGPPQAEIRSLNDSKLDFIFDFDQMVFNI